MKCESVRAQLTAYLDGDLEDDRGSAVRGHLRGCDGCRAVAADEAALRDGLRALPPLDPPTSLWAGVQRELAAAEVADAERPAWRRMLAHWAPRAPQLGLAGAAIAAAIVLLVVKAQRDDSPPGSAVDATQVVIAPAQERSESRPEPAPLPHGSCDLSSGDADVSAELAAESARVTECYAQAARELFEIVREAGAGWPDERRAALDAQLAALQDQVAVADDERARRAAYRKLIRALQRAAIHDDATLASAGGVR
jgi:hypothetical protein